MCMSSGGSGGGFAAMIRKAQAKRDAQNGGSTEVGPTNGFAPTEALTIGGTPRRVNDATPGSLGTGLQISRT